MGYVHNHNRQALTNIITAKFLRTIYSTMHNFSKSLLIISHTSLQETYPDSVFSLKKKKKKSLLRRGSNVMSRFDLFNSTKL